MSEKAQSRFDALDNNPRQKKLIFGGLIVFLSLIFFVGIGFGVKNVLLTEGTMELPAALPAFASPEPSDADKAINQLNTLIENAVIADNSNRAKLSVSTSFSVEEDSISDDSEDALFDDVLKFIKDDILSFVQENAYSFSSDFGDDFSDALITPTFRAENIKKFVCEASEGNESLRILSLVFNDEPFTADKDDVLFGNFNLGWANTGFRDICSSCVEIFTVADSDIICSDFEIRSEFDATDNRVSVIEYIRQYDITARLSFTGELETLGERTVNFTLQADERYDFTYAGLKFSQNMLWLEKGDIENFEVFATADDDVKITWSSSDSEIASVDEEGYIKGHKTSDKPVTITATFEYLGNTYDDSCTVYVRKPLKKIKLTESEINLKTGETHSVDVSFSPKSATVKTLFWVTDDESIASVDENGLITAVGPGTVGIYAVALDGNYKSLCTVTVEEGENHG